MLFFGGMVVLNRNPGRQRAESGRFLSRISCSLCIARCIFYRSDPDPGVRGSGHGAIPVHHHAAGP